MMKCRLTIEVTDEDILLAARDMGIDTQDVSPAWFTEVIETLEGFLAGERATMITYAVDQVGVPDRFENVNHERASNFCDWLAQRIKKNRGWGKDNQIDVYFTGQKDGMLALEMVEKDEDNSVITTHGLVNAAYVNDPHIEFDTLLSQVQFV